MRQLLKARIIEKYGSQYRFAREIMTSPYSVSAVVQGKKTPRGAALVCWCLLLDISHDSMPLFFGDEVKKSKQVRQ